MDNQIIIIFGTALIAFAAGGLAGFQVTKAYYVKAIAIIVETSYKAGYATALSKRSSGRGGEKEAHGSALEELKRRLREEL